MRYRYLIRILHPQIALRLSAEEELQVNRNIYLDYKARIQHNAIEIISFSISIFGAATTFAI